MDPVSIGSLILGIPSTCSSLSTYKRKFKKKFLNHDASFKELEKITQRVARKYIKRELKLGERVSVITTLDAHVMMGNLEGCIDSLKEIFQLSDSELKMMTDDFYEELMKTESSEILVKLQFRTFQGIQELSQNFSEFRETIERKYYLSTDFREITNTIIKYFKERLSRGELKEAFSRIRKISLDTLYGLDNLKYELVLIETVLIIKMERSEDLVNQYDKLLRIPDSFKKFYFMLLSKKEDLGNSHLNIVDFIQHSHATSYSNELILINELIDDINYEPLDAEIQNTNDEAKEIICKRCLLCRHIHNHNAVPYNAVPLWKVDRKLTDKFY